MHLNRFKNNSMPIVELKNNWLFLIKRVVVDMKIEAVHCSGSKIVLWGKLKDFHQLFLHRCRQLSSKNMSYSDQKYRNK